MAGTKKTAKKKTAKKKTAGGSGRRDVHLEFSDGKSNKFWQLSWSTAQTYAITFGRIGTRGSVQTKNFSSAAEALAAAEAVIASKLRKGYVESGAAPTATAETGGSSPAASSTEKVLRKLFEALPIDVGDATLFFHPEYYDPLVVQLSDGATDTEISLPAVNALIEDEGLDFDDRYDAFYDHVVPVLKKLERTGAFARFSKGLTVNVHFVDGSPEPVIDIPPAGARSAATDLPDPTPCHLGDVSRAAHYPTDTTGLALQWFEMSDAGYDNFHPISESLVVLGGSHRGVALFDLAARKQRWTFKKEHLCSERPFAYGELLVVPGNDGVYLLQLADGKQIARIAYRQSVSNNRASPIALGSTLCLFHDRFMQVIDVAARKKGPAVRYHGEFDEWDTHLQMRQQPAYANDRFWLFTKKGRKQFLEGISPSGDNVAYPLPQAVYVATSAIAYKGILYFPSADGRFYGIDLASGKITLSLELIDEITDPDRLDFSMPARRGERLGFIGEAMNESTKLYVVDLERGVLTDETIDLTEQRLTINAMVAGERAFYALSSWHSVLKCEAGKVVARADFSEGDFYNIEEQCFLSDGRLYVLVNKERKDSYHAGILCLA
ncbi:MAG: WGR domain-containing protein [Deltaproteobacteria bacterium]|nr:WGR domain-containing protein [Deltaproteobacteria bacterium]